MEPEPSLPQFSAPYIPFCIEPFHNPIYITVYQYGYLWSTVYIKNKADSVTTLQTTLSNTSAIWFFKNSMWGSQSFLKGLKGMSLELVIQILYFPIQGRERHKFLMWNDKYIYFYKSMIGQVISHGISMLILHCNYYY